MTKQAKVADPLSLIGQRHALFGPWNLGLAHH